MKIFFVGLFGSFLLRAINMTLRWERVGLDGEQRWWADKSPGILMFWHGRQLLMPWIYLNHRKSRKSPALTALISQHQDGRMVACGMRFLGVGSVAGSSSRGGLRALYELIDKLRGHSHIAITPDGPKGPARKLKNGVLVIAQRSGAVIYPSAYSAQRCWKFRSWDSMLLPKPFSRAVMVMGAPISVRKNMSSQQTELAARHLEDAINEVTDKADNYFKR